jgi:SH3-like domain-containing protein
MRSFYFTYILFFFLLLPAAVWAGDGHAQKTPDVFHTSGLPLPRFVSVEDDKAFVRAGPGEKYPIQWVIERKGLPVEIILEFENWRKIRDFDGQEGWMFQSLLSGERTGIVKSRSAVPVYQNPYKAIDKDSVLVMKLEPMVQVSLRACEDVWCKIESSGFSGWLQRNFIWGVYANENFD